MSENSQNMTAHEKDENHLEQPGLPVSTDITAGPEVDNQPKP
jgi:hypothetical protein